MNRNPLRELWRTLIRNPALLIVLGVILIFIVYNIFKQNNTVGGTSTSSTTPGPYYIALAPDLTGGNASTQPKTGNGLLGIIRTSQAGSGGQFASYDSTNTGVPLRSSAGATGNILSSIPFGSTVTITGSSITGESNIAPGQGSTIWYPVTYNGLTGFVNSEDFGNYTTGGHGPALPSFVNG